MKSKVLSITMNENNKFTDFRISKALTPKALQKFKETDAQNAKTASVSQPDLQYFKSTMKLKGVDYECFGCVRKNKRNVAYHIDMNIVVPDDQEYDEPTLKQFILDWFNTGA